MTETKTRAIRSKVPELMQARGLKVKDLNEHFASQTATNLARGSTSQFKLATIAKLCEILDCDPGDLFEFED